MAILLVFLALQFADFATTLWFLHHGAGEANPLVAALIRVSGQPALAVLLVKVAGLGLGVFGLGRPATPPVAPRQFLLRAVRGLEPRGDRQRLNGLPRRLGEKLGRETHSWAADEHG